MVGFYYLELRFIKSVKTHIINPEYMSFDKQGDSNFTAKKCSLLYIV